MEGTWKGFLDGALESKLEGSREGILDGDCYDSLYGLLEGVMGGSLVGLGSYTRVTLPAIICVYGSVDGVLVV